MRIFYQVILRHHPYFCTFSQISANLTPCRFFGFGGNQPSGAVILTSLLVLLAACGTAPTPSSTTPVEPTPSEVAPAPEPVVPDREVEPAEVPYTLAQTTAIYQDALAKFAELEAKAIGRRDTVAAKDFHAMAALLRRKFKPAEISAPDKDGMADVLTDNPEGTYNFVVFNPNLMPIAVFGMWTTGDAGVPLILLDGSFNNDWLTTAVLAHELKHAIRAQPYMKKNGDPDSESRRERFGRAAAREVLDTVSDGQYSKLIAGTAADIATPTDKNGFTAMYVDPALFDLFSVHHSRPRAWFYEQALFDLNVDLDRKSTKGKALEERLDRLNDRFLKATEDPAKAIQISWGADE